MELLVVVRLPSIEAKLVLGDKLNNFDYIKEVQSLAEAMGSKIKSLMISYNGKLLLDLPGKYVFQIEPIALEDIEQTMLGYSESLKVNIAVGIGDDVSSAMKACHISEKSGHMEFWHPKTDMDASKNNPTPENIADKKKIKDPPPEPIQVTAEEEIRLKNAYADAVAQAGIKSLNGVQEATAPEPQPMPPPVMQGKPGQPGATLQASEVQPEVPGQGEQSDNSPSEPTTEDGNPMQPDDMEMHLGGGKDAEREEKEGLLPQDEKLQQSNSTVDGLTRLLATLKMYMPELMGMAKQNPEGFKHLLKLASASVNMAKSLKINDFSNKEIIFERDKLVEVLAKATRHKKRTFHDPVGIIKEGKMKIKDPQTGREKWRQVQSGLTMDTQGAPISSKEYDKQAQGNEDPDMGKTELAKAPTPYLQEEHKEGDFPEFNIEKPNKPFFKRIARRTLPNGLIHEVYHGDDGESFQHILKHPKLRNPLADLSVNRSFEEDGDESYPSITHSAVNPKFKGKGLGRQLYLAALEHHGHLRSDYLVSPYAHNAWKAIKKNPSVDVYLAPYTEGNEQPHEAFIKKPLSTKSFPKVRISSGKKTSKIPGKKSKRLAASEILEKPYKSLAQERWAHTANGKKALGGNAAVHEWDEATKGKKLPTRVSKKR